MCVGFYFCDSVFLFPCVLLCMAVLVCYFSGVCFLKLLWQSGFHFLKDDFLCPLRFLSNLLKRASHAFVLGKLTANRRSNADWQTHFSEKIDCKNESCILIAFNLSTAFTHQSPQSLTCFCPFVLHL